MRTERSGVTGVELGNWCCEMKLSNISVYYRSCWNLGDSVIPGRTDGESCRG